MRALALTLMVAIAAGTAGCDSMCVFDSCGCGSSRNGGTSYAAAGDDPAQQSVTVGVGDVYRYDLRDFVYVYKAYGKDCVEDRSVRYPFQVADIQTPDSSVVDVSAIDGILELVGVSSGSVQVRVDLVATGLTNIGDASEFRELTLDVIVGSAPLD